MINLVEPGGSGERETLKRFTNNIYNGCDDKGLDNLMINASF